MPIWMICEESSELWELFVLEVMSETSSRTLSEGLSLRTYILVRVF